MREPVPFHPSYYYAAAMSCLIPCSYFYYFLQSISLQPVLCPGKLSQARGNFLVG